MGRRPKTTTAAVSPLEALPEGVQQLIGAALAAPPPPGVGSCAWHDPGTTTVAAAACMLACRGTQAIGLEAYRQLLARLRLPDVSQPPAGLSADSSVEALQAVLEGWGVEHMRSEATGRPVRSCRSAKLWRQLQEAVQPLCPVPESSRGAHSPLRNHVGPRAYLLLRPLESTPRDQIGLGLLQLQRTSLQQFGSVEGWQRAWLQEQRQQEEERQAWLRQQRQRAARRAELVAALHARGCELRDDSLLCAAYISSGEGEPQAIAVTIEELQFLDSHSGYSDCYRDILLHGDYTTDEEVSEQAKVQALHGWAQRYPGGPTAAADSSALPDSLRARVRAMAPKRPAKPKPSAASQCPAPPAPQQAAASPRARQQLEAAARQLALLPFTEEQMEWALDGSKVLVCRICSKNRRFSAQALAEHARKKHPSAAGLWQP